MTESAEDGPSRRHSRSRQGTACVLGGSFAGLLAARVLADHAERVILLEQDACAGRSQVHRSVPQGRHGHFMQPETLPLLERWFPGFVEDARALGAVLAPPGHYSLFFDGHPVRFPDVTMLMASRPLIENEIRRRVSALPNVHPFRARAKGLRYGHNAVRGVACTLYGSDGWGPERVLDVDVVVDAMGKGSRMSDWLERDGFDVPVVQRVPVGIGYTTALFTRPPDPREPPVACALDQFSVPLTTRLSSHPDSSAGPIALAVYAIEASQWQAVTMTYGPRPARVTADDIREMCVRLPDIFREATLGEPVGEPASYYYRESMRRTTADLERFPTGLFGVGDAVATFNPINGQGMMSAAIQASILATHFAAGNDAAARNRDFRELAEAAIDGLWKEAAGA